MVHRGIVAAAIAACLAASAPASPAEAQQPTLDEVLASYYEAVGGLEKIKSVQSMRMTGRMTMGEGMEAPFTYAMERPAKARVEFTFQGMTGIQAYDGETAWAVMPFLGKTEPEPMPADQAKEMKEQADMDGPLVDWKEKGHQLELLGEEEIEGTKAYKIKVAMADGDVQTYYLDAEAFVPIKVDGKRTIQGNEVEFETSISDYKEVDGLMLAHSIESKPKGAPQGQVITIDEIELDPELDDAQFEMPATAPAAEEEGTEG